MQTTALNHAVHPSVRNPKASRPKTAGEQIVDALVKDGLLPFRVALTSDRAVTMGSLLRDIRAAWGKSGSLGPVQLGNGGSSGTARCWQPEAHTDASLRVEHTTAALNEHERNLLTWLILASEKHDVTLAKLGREMFYVADEIKARIVATARLQALSDSVFEHYPRHSTSEAYKEYMYTVLRMQAAEAERKRQDAEQRPRQKIPIAA